MDQASVVDELVRAGSRLSEENNFRNLVSVLVEQSSDFTRSDLSCFYLHSPTASKAPLKLGYRRGLKDVPKTLESDHPFVEFLFECRESVVVNDRDDAFFNGVFLSEEMNSGIALPLRSGKSWVGLLFLNSGNIDHYGNARLTYLDSLARLAGGLMENVRLMTQLKEQYDKIEALERYQESIFESMTNLLVCTDENGDMRYYNRAAADSFGLSDANLGQPFNQGPGKGMGKQTLRSVSTALKGGRERRGLEGIYKNPQGVEMDFSMNAAPLKGKRGETTGQTLLFTDQSLERQLKAEAETAMEDRRRIKDMFSRYLSADLVKSLTDNPELVKPGGDKKTATVFFADITGYTSFSEGKDPAYIIEVLNAFFEEAVELVIRNNGYIDKFIGDCIMAAWGVPMKTEEEDAILAITSALEIHEAVRSKKRSFFKGEAEKLKISIGMSSGPLVAGNVGSSRRMDYTVLGDTVNTAARLESVATAEEIIISASTRDLIGDHFKIEKRDPVRVKGKKEPLVIFNVKGIN